MTERIEQIADGVTLYLGDCREVLPTLPKDGSVVTDPPYGINIGNPNFMKAPRQSRANMTSAMDNYFIAEDDRPFDPSHLLQFRSCVIWGANNFAHLLPSSRQWLIWDKRCGDSSDDQSDCEIAWSSFYGPCRLFSHKWRGMIKDSERDSKRVHPTQKPVALMEWAIERSFSAGAVLDPYMGSGTTGVAAVKLGRKFVGIEIEPKFFDIACKRVSDALKQPDMFIEKPAPAVQLGLLESVSVSE